MQEPPRRDLYIREQRAAGRDIYPLFNPIWAVPSIPFLTPPPNTDVVEHGESGKFVEYQTDRYGFENAKPIPSDSEQIDILIIGNSFGQGASVPVESTFAEVLKKEYGKNVYNASLAGSSSIHQLVLLRKFLKIYRPKVVLWCFFGGNDYRYLGFESTRPSLEDALIGTESHAFFDVSDDLRKDFEPNLTDSDHLLFLLEYIEWANEMHEKSRTRLSQSEMIIDWIANRRITFIPRRSLDYLIGEGRLANPVPEIHSRTEKLMKVVFQDGQKSSEAAGAKLVLVYIPSASRSFSDELSLPIEKNVWNRFIVQLAEDSGVRSLIY